MGASFERMVIGGVVIVTGLVGFLLGTTGRSVPLTTAQSSVTATTEPGIEVHVAGWVVAPGVVEIPDGSIVADAIYAAGGMKPGALSDRINLAELVAPGDQIIVPGPSDNPVGSADEGPLSLNRATAADLESLPGVGPVLAERIVSHRESSGRFESVEDLLAVAGIGETKLASIRDLVRP